jgi:ABC-2 type transport system permease protein
MIAVIKKELRGYFTSMTGYVSIAFLLLITGFYFVYINLIIRDPNYGSVLGSTSFIFVFMIPFITMRLFAEENRQRTDQLLFTSPTTIAAIVVAKAVAAITLYLIGMVVTVILPLSLIPLGEIPGPQIVSAYVGFVLIGVCFISIGVFISALTNNQIIAAVSTFVLLLMVFMMDLFLPNVPATRTWSFAFIIALVIVIAIIAGYMTKNYILPAVIIVVAGGAASATFFTNGALFEGLIFKVLNACSLTSRFSNFSSGVLSLADIIFYVSFSIGMIVLTIGAIEKRRWR